MSIILDTSLFEKQLGKTLTEELNKLGFKPAPEHGSKIEHLATVSVPTFSPILNPITRRKSQYRCKVFFEEAAEKILVLAIGQFKDIVIPTDFTTKAVNAAETMLEKAFLGHPDYRPYMTDAHEDGAPAFDSNKCVFINLAGLIVRDPLNDQQSLYWFASADSTIVKDDNKEVFAPNKIIEKKTGH